MGLKTTDQEGKSVMKVFIDPDVCIGCTLCTQACPEVFRMEGDKAIVYVISVPEEVKNTCRQAAEECPVNAIRISGQ